MCQQLRRCEPGSRLGRVVVSAMRWMESKCSCSLRWQEARRTRQTDDAISIHNFGPKQAAADFAWEHALELRLRALALLRRIPSLALRWRAAASACKII